MLKIIPNKRKLSPGFSWQRYAVKAIRFVTQDDVDLKYEGSVSGVNSGYNDWYTRVTDYIRQRCGELGLEIYEVTAQLIEEPNEDKSIEKLLWDQRKAVYIFSCWAYINGPIPSDVVQDTILPILGFWPNESIPHGAVAEIYDATVLSQHEQEAESPKRISVLV